MQSLLRSLAACAWILCVSSPAKAEEAAQFFSGKTLKFLVGMPPGGGVDAYARLVQRHLARQIPGTPAVIVQNMPGAGSLRSVMALAGSPEDGTAIGTFSSSLITAAITAPERVKIDFRRFAFLGNVSEDIRVCYVRSSSGVRTWRDLVEREQVIFGATAPGTSGNVDTAMLRNLFGIKLKEVQGYAGSADKRFALEKGEIDADCGGWSAIPEEWLRERKINVLIRISPTLPPGLDRAVPFGGDLLQDEADRRLYELLVAPYRLGRLFMVSAKIPSDRLTALRMAFDAMVVDPEFLAEAQRIGLPVIPMSGETVDRHVAELYTSPAGLVSRARALTGE